MKHLKTRILSAILSAAVLTSALPFMASADASALDYNVKLVDESFDGETNIPSVFQYKNSSVLTNGVVSASEKALNDADAHGDVYMLSKIAEEATNENGTANKGGDSFFRINYESSNNIDDRYIDNRKALSKVKTSMDVYLPEDFGGFNMRFLERYSQDPTSTTKGTNLAVVSKKTDSEGKATGAQVGFEGGATADLELNTWYTFEFYVDVESHTYDAYINGTQHANDGPVANLTESLVSFGIQKSNTLAAYTIYLDNISFAVPQASSPVPSDANVVWENNFDWVEEVDGALPSGSYDGKPAELSDIDYRAENCTYAIKTEDDGKYYHFYPNNSGKVANSGNIFQSGYFATPGRNLRDKEYTLPDGSTVTLDYNASYKDADGNTVYVDSADVEPYPFDVFPIDKLIVDMSIRLDSTFNTSITSYYYGFMQGLYNSANHILRFHDDGNISLISSDNIVGTYTPGEWMDITLYLNYADHRVLALKDGEFLGISTMQEKWEYANHIRIRTSPSENSDVTDLSALGVSVDNIKYSTTYSEDYINRAAYKGSTAEISKLDFEDLNVGDIIYKDGKSMVKDTEGNTKTAAEYYTRESIEATVVEDDADHGKALKLTATSTENLFGMARTESQKSYTYEEYGKYPGIFKFEAEFKKTKAAPLYLLMNGIGTGAAKNEMMVWFSDTGLSFNNGGTRAVSGVTRDINTWVKITLYMDFAQGKYLAYIDNEAVGVYAIPATVTIPELAIVYSTTNDAVLVDNISISTLPPYESSAITEYYDVKEGTKLGYVLNNADTENAYEYGVYCAKYSADGALEDITLAADSVAADTLGFKTLERIEAADGGYYTYFIWEDLVSLKPLFESKTIK